MSSDVYGFGVVLLEVLTGRRVLDVNRPKDELNLVQWATPLLSKKGTLRRIMDPKLEHRYPIKAAFEAATLILKCLESEPRNRPSIDEVLSTLEQINNVYMTPEEPKVNHVKNPGARRGLNNHRYRN